MRKIFDFKNATIFMIDKKQTITMLKEGEKFKPSKHSYYKCVITKQDIIDMYNVVMKLK